MNSNNTNQEHDDPLQKQFETLQNEWDSIKQSFSRSNRRSSVASGDHRLIQLCHNSPKELMSLLQLQSEVLTSGDHDRAAVEVIEQREVDFDNGRLRGRRLFEESDVGSEDNGGCFDVDEKSEVSMEFSCKSFENYDDNCDRFSGFRGSCMGSPERSVAVKGGGGGRGLVGRLMIWIGVMFVLAIVAFKCSGEDEQILVPT
ncbi:hypothetical protein HanIR_Chr02g0055521 [Helianthus annuus]|nr:hypothetical protein HanIR_Chr02g0055521 [Helianthus annuus]